MNPGLIQHFLESNASLRPEKIALVCGDRRLAYAEVDAQSNRVANALKQHGVRRGDRVIIFLNNCVEAVVAIFATLKADATFVVVNRATKPEKLAYISNNCRATALFLDSADAAHGVAAALFEQTSSLKFVAVCGNRAKPLCLTHDQCFALDDWLNEFPPSRPPTICIDRDLACLIYTSGSTGEPKGVMSDHSNMIFAVNSITEYLHNVESDIVINVLPLSFDYGLYQLLMVFKFGGTLVLENSFAFPSVILQTMERERVTGFPGVPTIFTLLLRMDLSQYDLASLRYLTNTAAALPSSHIEALQEKFHWAGLYSMYGLTETKRTLYLPPEELTRRPGSVGVPIPGTECWLEKGEGQRCRSGEVGELIVRGRHVMRGYWEAPEATARRFRPGPIPGERLCYTGDLFKQDDEGFFYFVSRSDDIIKSRGEKVAPKEVENILYSLKGVGEAAVIGVPDPVLGQAIKAIIAPVEGVTLTSAQVLGHCRIYLEDYMVPQQVEFRTKLPRTTSGKINRIDLK